MLSFDLQNFNHTFPLTLKRLNILNSTFLVVCLLLNTLFLLFFEVQLLIASAEPILLHFKVEKDHSYFLFSFLTSVDLFYFFFWGFQTLNTYTALCLFVDRIQKRNYYFTVSTLTSKNVSRTLSVVCFSLNMLFLPFSAFLV